MGNKHNTKNTNNIIIYISNDKEKFSIEINEFDTIKDIKEKIFNKKHFASDLQIISYKSNILEDNKTIKDYKIKNNSTISLKMKEISNPKEYFIMLNNHIGNDFYFVMKSSDTVYDMKNIEFNNELFKKYKLIFFYESQELEDSRTLYSYNLKAGEGDNYDFNKPNYFDLYNLPSHGYYIFIKRISGDKKPLFIPPTSTIQDAKNKIFELFNFPPKFQSLSTEDNKVLDNKKTLLYYKIKNKSTLNLALISNNGIIVFIQRFSGRKILLEVNQSETILEFKKKIQKIENIIPERQILCFEGEELLDNILIYEYNIKSESIIELCIEENGGILVYINTPFYKKISVHIQENDTIETLREFLSHRESNFLDEETYRLIYKGKYLEKSKTIKDYKMKMYDEIHEIVRLRGG